MKFDVDFKINSKSIEKKIQDVACQKASMIGLNVTCPRCGAALNLPVGKHICPFCKQSINITLN